MPASLPLTVWDRKEGEKRETERERERRGNTGKGSRVRSLSSWLSSFCSNHWMYNPFQFQYSEEVVYRFPPLFAKDTFRPFGPQILNSQIESPFLTGKLLFWTIFPMWISEFADKKSANNEGCLYAHTAYSFVRPMVVRWKIKIMFRKNIQTGVFSWY